MSGALKRLWCWLRYGSHQWAVEVGTHSDVGAVVYRCVRCGVRDIVFWKAPEL
jgi:hypothetical protein